MKKILLVNPPIYDFSAYDFWLRPYGLLTVAGYLQNSAQLMLFDYLDRQSGAASPKDQPDDFGRGKFFDEIIERPKTFKDIPRYYRRLGKPREMFRQFILEHQPFDFVLIQTVMTYWHLGVEEAIADIREICPEAKIILGGVYATICSEHAKTIGADFVLSGTGLEPLWDYMQITPDMKQLPYWQGYQTMGNGIIKLADGCPFKCTYCSVPKIYEGFKSRGLERAVREFDFMASLGIRNIAFYDDSLLHKTDEVLGPFLRYVISQKTGINFHTPNALNARFIKPDTAELMVSAGVKTFFIGYESNSVAWQNNTGGKVCTSEFRQAVNYLALAGADRKNITAYIIVGHPDDDIQQVEQSMHQANESGIKIMLAEFSPIPGTEDGQKCSKWVDMSVPLNHNKTAFTIWSKGFEESNRLKRLCKKLNKII